MRLRIAVLADVHGNLPALDAVLADLDRRGGADRLVDLGDRASGPLWPRETMVRLTALDALVVRGNHDRQVATQAPAAMSRTDRFTYDALDPAARAVLGAAPLTAWVLPGILACHATPERDDRYLVDEVDGGRLVRGRPAAIRARLGGVQAALVLCGHSHRPDLVALPGGPLVVNPGAVGCAAFDDPDDPAHLCETRAPHARYALLHLVDGNPGPIDFLAVPYDHEAAARQAEANGRPDWAHGLRTGLMPLAKPS